MQTTDQTTRFSTVRNRSLILTALIIVVTFFWVLMVVYTNLPTIALAGLALVSLLLLSAGTAWTVMAASSRSAKNGG